MLSATGRVHVCIKHKKLEILFSNQLILMSVLCVPAELVGGEDNPDSGPESSRHLPLV